MLLRTLLKPRQVHTSSLIQIIGCNSSKSPTQLRARSFLVMSTAQEPSSSSGAKCKTPEKSTDTDISSARASIVTIDGSKGEGGGQILRNAISYANILRQAVKIHNIRASRSKPGLRAQHVAGLRLACQVSGGTLIGDQLGSIEISYQPARHDVSAETERSLTGDIGTAGSICLLLQAALPCALLGCPSPCRMTLVGGTNASLAPQYDYWERVFLPFLVQHCGLDASQVQATVLRRGYFPRGGGEVQVRIEPCIRPLKPIRMTERGKVCEIQIRAFHAGRLPRHLAQKMANAALKYLQQGISDKSVDYHVEVVTEQHAVGSGLGILVVAKTTTGCLLAGSALSAKNKDAGDVGIEAAAELYSTLQDGGCVDEWLQDQLILFMALAEGTSELLTGSLTLHTQTAIMIAEEMAQVKFEVTKLSNGNPALQGRGGYGHDGRIPGKHLIRCVKGLGLQPVSL